MSDRFELLGMLGRGGTATVHLANDSLRGHPVALKIVHPHLADDPAVRRRLRREVGAASLIQHPAALVPYDLHEVDGSLALSMPWHPGETLADRVSRSGRLSPTDVAVLASRLTGALQASHRAGVLHRDITAANVLLEQASDAVLSDFGLARVTKTGTQATTGLLGTAGYAAPEVYSGSRADPRSDLYGLGATLYLAATGVPAFDPQQPMAALKAQLDDGYTPVRDLAPDVPKPLAHLIEQLLHADPEARPHGAAEVLEILEGRASAPEKPREATAALALPTGNFTLLVKERDADRMRRNALRSAADSPRGTLTFEEHMANLGRMVADGLRNLVGWPPEDGQVSPEQQLANAVAVAAGQPGTLAANEAMLQKKFRLIDRTDEPTARSLQRQAKNSGFDTEVHQLRDVPDWWQQASRLWWIAIFPMTLFASRLPPTMQGAGWAMVGITIAVLATLASRANVQRRLGGRPVAFYTHALPTPMPTTAASPVEVPEGQRLLQRATDVLDGLDRTLADDDQLPEPAKVDLRATSKRLRTSAQSLAKRHQALSATLDQHGSTSEQVAGLSSRLARLDTLARSGRPIDGDERTRLEAALAQHTADEAAAEEVESELISTQAQLIELCSTASRVRRELVQQGPRHSADDLVQRLQRQADAVDRARKEASRGRRRE